MKTLFFVISVMVCTLCAAQNDLDQLLKKYNTNDVPYISVEELAMPKTDAIILDSRELDEYNVSHLKGAFHVGYNNFNINQIEALIPHKTKNIAVYCSLGIRSETIGNELLKAGYTNVSNLYGGIFEWKNKNFTVVDSLNKRTERVHAFSKAWSKWLINGEKVFTKKEKK
jgi:rhodanese-related sulfurtransferase